MIFSKNLSIYKNPNFLYLFFKEIESPFHSSFSNKCQIDLNIGIPKTVKELLRLQALAVIIERHYRHYNCY